MAWASASLSGPPSTSPQCLLSLVLRIPHFMLSANPASTGLFSNTFGSESSDCRGGSSDDGAFFVPRLNSAMFCGADRNSIHFHAASAFLLCEKITSASPAIVVAQGLPSSIVGSGAVAHLPVIFG